MKRSRIWIFRVRRRTFQRRSESERRKVWLIAERSSPETGRWGGAERNGMVIVASQRLEPEGLGTLLKPRDGRNLLKAVGGEEKGRFLILPSSGHPSQCFFPAINLIDLLTLRRPFPWHSLCNGSRT